MWRHPLHYPIIKKSVFAHRAIMTILFSHILQEPNLILRACDIFLPGWIWTEELFFLLRCYYVSRGRVFSTYGGTVRKRHFFTILTNKWKDEKADSTLNSVREKFLIIIVSSFLGSIAKKYLTTRQKTCDSEEEKFPHMYTHGMQPSERVKNIK